MSALHRKTNNSADHVEGRFTFLMIALFTSYVLYLTFVSTNNFFFSKLQHWQPFSCRFPRDFGHQNPTVMCVSQSNLVGAKRKVYNESLYSAFYFVANHTKLESFLSSVCNSQPRQVTPFTSTEVVKKGRQGRFPLSVKKKIKIIFANLKYSAILNHQNPKFFKLKTKAIRFA